MHAMIVAHPDDECLWATEPLIAAPNEWEVIVCSTPTFDKERIWNFAKAMKLLGVVHTVLEGQDSGMNSELQFTLPNISGYESILTHNRIGEYGHKHHKLVYSRVIQARPDAVSFGWGLASPKLTRRLSDERFSKKKAALLCYGEKFYHGAIKSWFGGVEDNLRTETYADSLVRI